MKHETTHSDRDYPLQVGRQYKVRLTDYWLSDYSETVTLAKITKRGMVTICVVTTSALVGIQSVKVPANTLIWNEI
jgi:hypothetical protein